MWNVYRGREEPAAKIGECEKEAFTKDGDGEPMKEEVLNNLDQQPVKKS